MTKLTEEQSALIIAYAQGKVIECKCRGWQEWMPLTDMRDSALRTFFGMETDTDWSFRIATIGV